MKFPTHLHLAVFLFSFPLICRPLQVMEFYCESCETAMCLDCTEGEHREHVTVPLRDVVEQHKAVLKTQLDAIHSRWLQPSTLIKLLEGSPSRAEAYGPDSASAIKDNFTL